MSIFDLKQEVKTSAVKVGDSTFYIKHISALERDRFESQWLEYKPSDSVHGIRAFAAVFCLCDKDGALQHPSGDGKTVSPEFNKAVEHAQKLPASVVAPLADVALKVNSFSQSDVEELEKN